ARLRHGSAEFAPDARIKRCNQCAGKPRDDRLWPAHRLDHQRTDHERSNANDLNHVERDGLFQPQSSLELTVRRLRTCRRCRGRLLSRPIAVPVLALTHRLARIANPSRFVFCCLCRYKWPIFRSALLCFPFLLFVSVANLAYFPFTMLCTIAICPACQIVCCTIPFSMNSYGQVRPGVCFPKSSTGKFFIRSSSRSRLLLQLSTSSFHGMAASAHYLSASHFAIGHDSLVFRIRSFQSNKCCSSSAMECVPLSGFVTACRGAIRASNSATLGPYHAPPTVTFLYASAISSHLFIFTFLRSFSRKRVYIGIL